MCLCLCTYAYMRTCMYICICACICTCVHITNKLWMKFYIRAYSLIPQQARDWIKFHHGRWKLKVCEVIFLPMCSWAEEGAPRLKGRGKLLALDRLVIDFPLHMWARIRITDRDVPRLCPWLSLVQSVAVFHCVYVKTRKHVSTRATNMDTGTASVLQQYVPYLPSLSLHVNRFCNGQRFLLKPLKEQPSTNGAIPYFLPTNIVICFTHWVGDLIGSTIN